MVRRVMCDHTSSEDGLATPLWVNKFVQSCGSLKVSYIGVKEKAF